jgi:hypothetical protein
MPAKSLSSVQNLEIIDLTNSDVEIIPDSDEERDDASLILIEEDEICPMRNSTQELTELQYLGTLDQNFQRAKNIEKPHSYETNVREICEPDFTARANQQVRLAKITYLIEQGDLEKEVDPFKALRDLKKSLQRLPNRPPHWRSFENRTLTGAEQDEMDAFRSDIVKELLSTQAGRDLMSFLIQQDQRLIEFVKDPFESDFITMNRMPHPIRCILRKQAGYYGLRVEPRGERAQRYWVLLRTNESRYRRGDCVRFFVENLETLFWNEWEVYQRQREEDMV